MNDEEIQAMINYWDWKYEEECRNRVHPVALVAVIGFFLIIALILASI